MSRSCNAVCIHKFGGPEVLTWETISVGDPRPNEVLLRHVAVGLNFVDVVQRRGVMTMKLPAILGRCGMGVVEAIGDAVTTLKIGDRVAYAPYNGAYAEYRLIAARKVVLVPEGLGDKLVGATFLQGLTAQYLVRQIRKVAPGDRLLVHAAAGGVGSILCQWASALGAVVIGAVSSAEKAVTASSNGCQYTINYNDSDFVERIKELFGGEGVDAVYDSVGLDTFTKSLECLKVGGQLISYGFSSGAVPALDINILGPRALTISKGTLTAFTEQKNLLHEMAAEWFAALQAGVVKVSINQTYPLSEIIRAHTDLENRRTIGSSAILI